MEVLLGTSIVITKQRNNETTEQRNNGTTEQLPRVLEVCYFEWF
ncbi:hypothetical protein ACYRFS_02685 [Listeria kieliensis]